MSSNQFPSPINHRQIVYTPPEYKLGQDMSHLNLNQGNQSQRYVGKGPLLPPLSGFLKIHRERQQTSNQGSEQVGTGDWGQRCVASSSHSAREEYRTSHMTQQESWIGNNQTHGNHMPSGCGMIKSEMNAQRPTMNQVAIQMLMSRSHLVRRPGVWEEAEDEQLKILVEKYGAQNWKLVAKTFKNKTAKQCRDRWHKNLDPTIYRGPWTNEENAMLMDAQSRVGNRWAVISRLFPGRTPHSIKNRFHTLERMKHKQTMLQHANLNYM